MMSTVQDFFADSNVNTDEGIANFIEDCKLILDFMYEYDFSCSESNFQYVRKLHDGTSLDLEDWKENKSAGEWIEKLQSIKTFPTYTILVEFKQKIEEVICQWVKDR